MNNEITLPEAESAPGWLLDIVVAQDYADEQQIEVTTQPNIAPKYCDAALASETSIVAASQPGARNATLNKAAYALGGLLEAGLTEDQVVAELAAAARGAGLGDREIATTIRSGLNSGKKKPRKIKEARHARASSPPNEPEKCDLDQRSHINNITIESGAQEERPIPPGVHYSENLKTGDIKIAASEGNALALCLADERLDIRWNRFSGRAIWRNCPWKKPGPMQDSDGSQCALYMQSVWYGAKFGPDALLRCLTAASETRSYDPLQEYLTALRWDNQPRIDTWLGQYFGCKETVYAQKIGSWWLISGVARAMEPGCQVDHILVLQGNQGVRKSTSFQALCAGVGLEYFTCDHIDISSKDGAQSIQGKWLIECSELGKMRKAEAADVKAFLSRAVDHYRPTYGRCTIDVPRRSIFAGTTDEDEILRDPTGDRRYWPIAACKCDPIRLGHDADQLWAEAYIRYMTKNRWWPESQEEIDMCSEEQQSWKLMEPWTETLAPWVARMEEVTVGDAAQRLNLMIAHLDQHARRRIVIALRECGLTVRTRRRIGNVRTWVFRRPDAPNPL